MAPPDPSAPPFWMLDEIDFNSFLQDCIWSHSGDPVWIFGAALYMAYLIGLDSPIIEPWANPPPEAPAPIIYPEPPAIIEPDPPAIIAPEPPAIIAPEPPAIIAPDPPPIIEADPPAIIYPEPEAPIWSPPKPPAPIIILYYPPPAAISP